MALNHLKPLLKSCLVIAKVEGSSLTLCHPNGEILNKLIEQKQHEDVFRNIQGTQSLFRFQIMQGRTKYIDGSRAVVV